MHTRVLHYLFIFAAILSYSCSGNRDIDISKPTMFISTDDTTKILYDNDKISKIIKTKEYRLSENHQYRYREQVFSTRLKEETYYFEYQKGLLSKVNIFYMTTSFGGITKTNQETLSVKYNNDKTHIASITIHNNTPITELYSYDGEERLFKIETQPEGHEKPSPNRELTYDSHSNVTAYCSFFDTKCRHASDYDEKLNPYFAVNYMLGYPFFRELEHLSQHNPMKVEHKISGIDIPTRVDNHTYQYDSLNRVVGIDGKIMVRY